MKPNYTSRPLPIPLKNENENEGSSPRWESAHAYHGTRMWREFVAARPEWAELANGYKPEEAEQLAKDRAEELSSDESDAGLPALEPVGSPIPG